MTPVRRQAATPPEATTAPSRLQILYQQISNIFHRCSPVRPEVVTRNLNPRSLDGLIFRRDPDQVLQEYNAMHTAHTYRPRRTEETISEYSF